ELCGDAVNLHLDVVLGREVAIPGILRFADVWQGNAVDAQFYELTGRGAQAGLADAAGEIQRDLQHGHGNELVVARRIVSEALQLGGIPLVRLKRVSPGTRAEGEAP